MKRLSIITSGCAPPDLRWNASASRAAWIQRVRHYRRQGRAVQRARSDRQNVSELGSIDAGAEAQLQEMTQALLQDAPVTVNADHR